MAFRALTGRIGRTATAVGSAAGGTVMVAPGHAHARAPPTPVIPQVSNEHADPSSSLKHCEDDWLLPQLDKDEVLFMAEDIAEARDCLRQVTVNALGQRLLEHDDSSSENSEGMNVNDVIELAESTQLNHPAPLGTFTNISPQNINLLMEVASELLSKPTVQREILDVIATHPQLSRHVLEAAGMENGFHTNNLPAAVQPILIDAVPVVEEVTEDKDGDSGDVWGNIVQHIAGAFKHVGHHLGMAVEQVGHWLQAIMSGKQQMSKQAGEGARPEPQQGNGARGVQGLMKATLVVAVVIACMVLARRPAVAARVVRAMTKKVPVV